MALVDEQAIDRSPMERVRLAEDADRSSCPCCATRTPPSCWPPAREAGCPGGRRSPRRECGIHPGTYMNEISVGHGEPHSLLVLRKLLGIDRFFGHFDGCGLLVRNATTRLGRTRSQQAVAQLLRLSDHVFAVEAGCGVPTTRSGSRPDSRCRNDGSSSHIAPDNPVESARSNQQSDTRRVHVERGGSA